MAKLKGADLLAYLDKQAEKLGFTGKEAMAWVREELFRRSRERERERKGPPRAGGEQHGDSPMPFKKGHRGKVSQAKRNLTAALLTILNKYSVKYAHIYRNRKVIRKAIEPLGMDVELVEEEVTRAFNFYTQEIKDLDPWLDIAVDKSHRKIVADINKVMNTRLKLPSQRTYAENVYHFNQMFNPIPDNWKVIFGMSDGSFMEKLFPFPQFETRKDVIDEIENTLGGNYVDAIYQLVDPVEVVHGTDQMLHGRSPFNTLRNMWRTFSDNVHEFFDERQLQMVIEEGRDLSNSDHPRGQLKEKETIIRLRHPDEEHPVAALIGIVTNAPPAGELHSVPDILRITDFHSRGIKNWRKWLPELKSRLGVSWVYGPRTSGASVVNRAKRSKGRMSQHIGPKIQWLKFSDAVHNFAFESQESIDDQLEKWRSNNLTRIENAYRNSALRVEQLVMDGVHAWANRDDQTVRHLDDIKQSLAIADEAFLVRKLSNGLNAAIDIAQMALNSFGANVSRGLIKDINNQIADLDDQQKKMAQEIQDLTYGIGPVHPEDAGKDNPRIMVIGAKGLYRKDPKELKNPLPERRFWLAEKIHNFASALIQPNRREERSDGPTTWHRWKFDLLDRDMPKGTYQPGSVTLEAFPGRSEADVMDIELPSHLEGSQSVGFYRQAMDQLKTWLPNVNQLMGRRTSGAKYINPQITSRDLPGFPSTIARVKFSEGLYEFVDIDRLQEAFKQTLQYINDEATELYFGLAEKFEGAWGRNLSVNDIDRMNVANDVLLYDARKQLEYLEDTYLDAMNTFNNTEGGDAGIAHQIIVLAKGTERTLFDAGVEIERARKFRNPYPGEEQRLQSYSEVVV